MKPVISSFLITFHVSNYASAKTIRISNQTGDTSLNNISADQITLSCSTGDTILNDVTSEYINSSGSTGDLDLINVNATKTIRAERSTGDITLRNSDAYELYQRNHTVLMEKDQRKLYVAICICSVLVLVYALIEIRHKCTHDNF